MIVEAAEREPVRRKQEFRVAGVARSPAHLECSLRREIQRQSNRRADHSAGSKDCDAAILRTLARESARCPAARDRRNFSSSPLRRIQFLIDLHACDALEQPVVKPERHALLAGLTKFALRARGCPREFPSRPGKELAHHFDAGIFVQLRHHDRFGPRQPRRGGNTSATASPVSWWRQAGP